LLQDVVDGDLERLAAGASLLTPGSAEIQDGRLYREGDRADAVYLVRSGTIKLAHETQGGEIVLSYVVRGGVFGLEPLLTEAPAGALLLRCVSHPALATVSLDKPLTIGRGETCEIALPADDRGIGRRHCQIEQRDGSYYAVDLQSANFTLVNGERIQEAKLHVGDRIAIVQYTFEIVAAAAGDATAAARSATASGLDDFEVVALSAADLHALASSAYPIAASHAHGSVLEVAPRGVAIDGAILDPVVTLNLYNSQNVLLIDLERCTRCDECVRACATAHDGVARFTRDGPRFGNYLVTMACRSCTDPKCMVGCPVGSIRRRDSLEIHIEDWCIGCQRCANQCPFGNINMVELAAKPDLAPPISEDVKLRATVCDLCAGYDGPNCVYACPHDAAIRVNPAAFLSAEDQR
jgi:Fe-S-cluster-containing hydrogenase component 2/CRP-like cAMP-binding protein